MGNRSARRAQPQPVPLPMTTYIPGRAYPPGPAYPSGPAYPPGPAYPYRGQQQMGSPCVPNQRRGYPRYSPPQPYY